MSVTKSSTGGSGKRTSPADASKASELLRNPKTPPNVKSVAGSDLSQRGKAKTGPKKPGR